MRVRVPFLDLSAAQAEAAGDLRAAFERVTASGRWVLGPEVEAFEREWAQACATEHAIGVGSGLDALTLALRALGIGPGDEVVVPAQTFVATWLAVSATGATPVGADVDDATGNLDPAATAAAAGPRTRAIVPVHLFGQPADMTALRAVAAPRALAVVEDAAQAHGALWAGVPAGALGHVAAFSFYPGKNLGALGDGGAVTTGDPALAEQVRLLRNYGSQRKYVHEAAGVNSRLDELQAAFLRAKLERLEAWNARRRAVAARYLEALADVETIRLPAVRPEAEPAWHLFAVRCEQRDALAEHLGARGVETLVHYPTLPHRTGAYARPGRFPRAEAWAAQELSLPIGPHMTSADVDLVVDAVRAFAPRPAAGHRIYSGDRP
jgi:dTDP-3-amino-3,4,6-trideoxy-alpha-D-glucose transaminase